ncbi:MAG: DUF5667 domain-containing protein [Candidatus Woesearchaeota archaeon]|nr:DUF5667 domain-containing protein [Candidatus Woesearchaeota archaeon]
MKKIASVFVALLMLLSVAPMAFAQEAAEEPVVMETVSEEAIASEDIVVAAEPETSEETLATEDVVEEAGVTPDQTILWNIEQAVEAVDVALTFDEAEAAEKSLEYAEERLAEAQVMAEQENAEAIEKALTAQEENIADAEEAASEISDGDPEKALEIQAQIQAKFQAQYEHTAQVKAAILARMQSKWTPEKYAKISANFDRMLARHKLVKERLDARQEKIKTKVQAKTGKTAEEVQQIQERIKNRTRAEIEEGKVKDTGKRVRTETAAEKSKGRK